MAVDLTMGMLLAALEGYRWYKRLRICTQTQSMLQLLVWALLWGPVGHVLLGAS